MTKFAIFSTEGLPLAFYAEDVHGSRMRPVYGPQPQRAIYGAWPQMEVYGPTPEPTEAEPNPIAPIVGTIDDPSKQPEIIGEEDDPDQARPVIGEESNPDCLIPPDAIAITEQQWRDFIENSGRRKWVDGDVAAYEPPAPEAVIPDRLSRRQFRLALIDSGLLEQVEGWVANQDIRTQAAYADSSTFLRTDEMLQQGFASLGLAKMQVDQFFMNAAAL